MSAPTLRNNLDTQPASPQRPILALQIPIVEADPPSSGFPFVRLSKRRRSPEEQLSKAGRTMGANVPQSRFPCPFYQMETDRGLPHVTCLGRGGDHMSGLLKHLMRYHMRVGKPQSLPFLQKCRICKHYFIDKEDYLANHNVKCDTHNPFKKGDAAEAHYKAFKEMVLLYITKGIMKSTSKCNSTGWARSI
jgi:hypothetical protein